MYDKESIHTVTPHHTTKLQFEELVQYLAVQTIIPDLFIFNSTLALFSVSISNLLQLTILLVVNLGKYTELHCKTS